MRVNWAAIVVSAVVYWLLGAVWYGFLFAKPYVALEHLTAEQLQAASPVLPYIVTFFLNLLIAFVLAQVCIWRNANTPSRGAAVGILLWIGFVGPVTFTTYMYEMRPLQLFAINEFYSLVGLFLMGLIIGGWTKKAV
jgi:fluoride ion exporter CrcB/FEX